MATPELLAKVQEMIAAARAKSDASDDVVTGSCLCKAVKYKATGNAVWQNLCHCFNCRKAGGSYVAASVCYFVDKVDVFEGADKIKVYQDPATDSGTPLARKFCSICGSSLFQESPLGFNMMGVCAGSLDAPFCNDFVPVVEQYCETKAKSAPQWVQDTDPETPMSGRFTRNMMTPKVNQK